MSTAVTDASEIPVSRQQVEDLLRQCDALKAAVGRGQVLRWILLLGFLAFMGVFGWLYWQLFQKLQSKAYQDEVVRAAQKKLETRSELYMGEVRTLVDSASPVVAEAFRKQAQTDLPVFLQSVQAEGDALSRDMGTRLETELHGAFEQILAQSDKALQEEMPQLNDPVLRKRLSQNLVKALERMAQKYLVEEMQNRAVAIYDLWGRFPIAARPHAGDPPTQDRFVGELTELLQYRLVNSDRRSAR